ncbi:hypothetical protein C0J52_27530, partial [Blattella germanica]
IQWPDWSPDLSAPNFFLWVYLKEKCIHHHASKLGTIMERIRDAMRKVLECVMNNVQSRIQQCVQNDGAHLIDVLFKK